MKGIIDFFKSLIKPEVSYKKKKQTKRRRIFLAADLHLDHKNIIKYCHRPFRSVQQMNAKLIKNWNKTVRKTDTVYFLGDLAFGRGSKNTDYWYRKLNGRIIFIKGNHDKSRKIRLYNKKYLTYKGFKFLLVHSPSDVPKYWKGWVIHGHKHTNSPKFPLVNKKTKRINVSCELTRYKPININVLIKKIK